MTESKYMYAKNQKGMSKISADQETASGITWALRRPQFDGFSY
jgi:hypothetical protein